MWRYSMAEFAPQAVALLDHLKIEQAVVGGTSMGANITLELAALAPERLRGMLLEMPVLDNAIPACAAAFTPLLFVADVRRAGGEAARPRRPRRAPGRASRSCSSWGSTAVAQDPGPAPPSSRGSSSAARRHIAS